MTFYKQLTAFRPTQTFDLRDRENDIMHNSADLQTVGTTLSRTPKVDAEVRADVDIARHIYKGNAVQYTIEFRRKAIDRLRLDEDRQIVLCLLEQNPDTIYIESVERSDRKQFGVFNARKLRDCYQIVCSGKAHIDLLDEFLDGDTRRLYPLFKDDHMDGEHYMIKKGKQWDESRRRWFGESD